MIDAGLRVRPVTEEERPLLAELLEREWGSRWIVSRSQLYDASASPAFGCFENGRLVGLATYELSAGECQVLSLNAIEQRQGIGSELLRAVTERARAEGCDRLWLVTSNDNVDALRFYQRRGMRLVAVYPGAMDSARALKAAIPDVGSYGIPIRDELELELRLVDQPSSSSNG